MSDQGTPVYAGGEREFDEPRMSALAVVGLVCSLICLIPALPLIGAALGGAALLKINSSGGRLAGVGMALVAICVGAVLTLGQAGLGYFGWRSYSFVQQFLGPTAQHAGDAMVALAASDPSKLKNVLTEEAVAKVTPEDVAQFTVAMEAHYGKPTGVVTDIFEMIQGVKRAPGFEGDAQVKFGGKSGNPPLPAVLRFPAGKVAVLFISFDPNSMKGKRAKGASAAAEIFRGEDLLLLLPGRKAVTLLKDGPARGTALGMGIEPVYGDAALPKERAPAAESSPAPEQAPGSPAQEQR